MRIPLGSIGSQSHANELSGALFGANTNQKAILGAPFCTGSGGKCLHELMSELDWIGAELLGT